jgi:putative transposase
MVTGSTYQSERLMRASKRKEDWRDAFHRSAEIYQWQIIAWVVLDNHYHAVVRSPVDPKTLSKFIGSYHKYTARKWNSEDGLIGRKVWWNYWDTCIRSERDYLNRLKYVFWNPLKHGLVNNPEDYPHGNYRDFLEQWQTGLDFAGIEEVRDVPEF